MRWPVMAATGILVAARLYWQFRGECAVSAPSRIRCAASNVLHVRLYHHEARARWRLLQGSSHIQGGLRPTRFRGGVSISLHHVCMFQQGFCYKLCWFLRLNCLRYAQDPGVPEFPISQRHRGSEPEHAQRPSGPLFCLHLTALVSFRRRPATALSPHLPVSAVTPKKRKECLLNQFQRHFLLLV